MIIPPRSKTRRGAAHIAVGEGEPLVLLHGVGLRLEAWTPQIEALSASRRVIAFDLPGHGGSAALPVGADLRDFVAWFGDALDDLGLDRVNLAGHSMGALIAGGAAVDLASRIARVALINGVHRRQAEARAAVIARSAEITKGRFDIEGPLARWFPADAGDTEACRLTRSLLAEVSPEGYAIAYHAFAHGDAVYADALSRIACPALCLTGEDDPNSTPDMARSLAAAIPKARAVVIEGHRHMVNLTAPDQVNARLADWLAW